MICIVGVIQVKYCYRMNINSVQIQFIQYAFHSNQLQVENASKNENLYSMVILLPSCAFKNFFVTYWCIFCFEAENKKTKLN